MKNRRRWQVDVLPCVFGHITYAPDEPELLRGYGVLRIMSGIVFLVAAFGIWRFNESGSVRRGSRRRR